MATQSDIDAGVAAVRPAIKEMIDDMAGLFTGTAERAEASAVGLEYEQRFTAIIINAVDLNRAKVKA